YRRRFTGLQGAGARPVRKLRATQSSELVLGAVFSEPNLLDGTLTLLRRVRRPWTGAERMRFSLLQPLITQVLEGAARAEVDSGARERLLAAAERADAPILLFDASGTILFANQAADALLSHQTEQGLSVLCDDRRSTPLLCHLMRLAAAEPPVAKIRLALTNGRSLDARIATVPVSGDDPPVRIVTLRERAALTLEDVRPQLFSRGVSDRESDVVACVLQGMRNAEIGAQLFISEYTVKDHLKHVFQKLGVESRAGLIRNLYAAPAPDALSPGEQALPPAVSARSRRVT
ncbi:MAG: LuxR C-terminal-related transcriptional regulator, partial [Thermoanaerobaculia bacterium]